MEKELAIRILNFVMPYIPEHIKDECLEIIKRETSKPVSIKDNTKHNYAHTIIMWKDDCSKEEVVISLKPYNERINDKVDEGIFFYCENEEDYERLQHYDNGEDFVVIGCTLFTDTL
jgi:hypothetical protein